MNLVIFGAGKMAKALLRFSVKPEHKILKIFDNNNELWGKTLNGYFIEPLDHIQKQSFDIVIVTIVKERIMAYQQLWSLGVPNEKIIMMADMSRMRYCNDVIDQYFEIPKSSAIQEISVKHVNEQSLGETRKAQERRMKEGFFEKYCVGKGLDIGCGDDPLIDGIYGWDLVNGDAQYLEGIPDEFFDFVYSSHCLEHMVDVRIALRNWFRVVRQNGYLILYIPERDLYEKRKRLPSRWNADHKHMFLIGRSEYPDTLDIVKEISSSLQENFKIYYIKLCNDGYAIRDPKKHSVGEYSIEIVLQKVRELNEKGIEEVL